ncbi:glycosyltransferase family 4 protein [Microbacterium deminutum]|uniref:Glycosyltransferase family 4 protein n=1 Tax=Microbacterium deminutum TaxID=344164 RepID=A0ABN2Q5S3_9MICO
MNPGGGGVVHLVVPDDIDDQARVSGGNVCDRRVRDGLIGLGWTVRVSPVAVDAPAAAHQVLSHVPDGELVLIDGLVATRSPAAVEVASERLRIVVLAHMVSAAFPDADPRDVDGERRALWVPRAVIATSAWTRSELLSRNLVPFSPVVVALPGSDDAVAATGTPSGGALLCVGVVAPHKGQDTLVEALANLEPGAPWTCTIVGSLESSPEFAERVARLAEEAGLGDRVRMAGVLGADELDRAYRRADLLVAPSRAESYGMAIADALRRGIPVVASSAGGIPQTVARSHAAVLVPPGEPRALSTALQRWMVDPALRARLADEARRGRSDLPRWDDSIQRIAKTLAGVR